MNDYSKDLEQLCLMSDNLRSELGMLNNGTSIFTRDLPQLFEQSAEIIDNYVMPPIEWKKSDLFKIDTESMSDGVRTMILLGNYGIDLNELSKEAEYLETFMKNLKKENEDILSNNLTSENFEEYANILPLVLSSTSDYLENECSQIINETLQYTANVIEKKTDEKIRQTSFEWWQREKKRLLASSALVTISSKLYDGLTSNWKIRQQSTQPQTHPQQGRQTNQNWTENNLLEHSSQISSITPYWSDVNGEILKSNPKLNKIERLYVTETNSFLERSVGENLKSSLLQTYCQIALNFNSGGILETWNILRLMIRNIENPSNVNSMLNDVSESNYDSSLETIRHRFHPNIQMIMRSSAINYLQTQFRQHMRTSTPKSFFGRQSVSDLAIVVAFVKYKIETMTLITTQHTSEINENGLTNPNNTFNMMNSQTTNGNNSGKMNSNNRKIPRILGDSSMHNSAMNIYAELLEDESEFDVPIWPLIFYCIRAGDFSSVLNIIQSSGSADVKFLSQFIEQFYEKSMIRIGNNENKVQIKNYGVENKGNQLKSIKLYYRRTIRYSNDPFKKLVFCILGKLNSQVTEFSNHVIDDIETYLWLKLIMIHQPNIEDVSRYESMTKSNFTYNDEMIGSDEFDLVLWENGKELIDESRYSRSKSRTNKSQSKSVSGKSSETSQRQSTSNTQNLYRDDLLTYQQMQIHITKNYSEKNFVSIEDFDEEKNENQMVDLNRINFDQSSGLNSNINSIFDNNNLILYVQLLFLSGQFERGIDALLRMATYEPHAQFTSMTIPNASIKREEGREKMRLCFVHAFHMALALYDAGLLILPTHTLLLFAPFLSHSPMDFMPIQRLNMPILLSLFVKERISFDDVSLGLCYFYIIRNIRDTESDVPICYIQIDEMLVANKQYKQILGFVDATDGKRKKGLIHHVFREQLDEKKTCYEMIQYIATECENRGDFTNVLNLYELTKNYGKLLKILNSLLANSLIEYDNGRTNINDIQQVAKLIIDRFTIQQAQESILTNSKVKSDYQMNQLKTAILLLELLKFFDAYRSNNYPQAISIMDQLNIIPTNDHDMKFYIDNINLHSQSLRLRLADIIEAVIDCYVHVYQKNQWSYGTLQHTNRMAGSSINSQKNKERIRERVRLIVQFTSLLPYFFSGEFLSKLTKIEIELMR
ncbi:hypothetical protein SNEBB_002107 [Seison nebaliae]|nr:hypothetical protein SNEBB_002107 [Seison nebaliae]